MLMNLRPSWVVLWSMTTPSPRGISVALGPGPGTEETRSVFEDMTSKPQYQVCAPFTKKIGNPPEFPPSMMARSPAYCRRMIGLPEVPVS